MGEELSTMQPAGLAEVIDRKVVLARIVDTVEAALKALPDTDEGIAEYFRDNGIRGGHSAYDCPVASYLTAALVAGGLPQMRANVSSYRINVYDREGEDSGVPMVWWLKMPSVDCGIAGCKVCERDRSAFQVPDAVSAFVESHDGGKFPFLETPKADRGIAPSLAIIADQLAPA